MSFVLDMTDLLSPNITQAILENNATTDRLERSFLLEGFVVNITQATDALKHANGEVRI